MTLRNKIAAVCIGINILIELAVGVAYFTASEIMPYHQVVLGVDWDSLAPGVQTLFVAFINAYGSAHFAVGVALAVLLLIPMRKGEAWARWATLAVGLPVLGMTAYVSTSLGRGVEGGPQWQGAIGLLVIFLVGVFIYQPTAEAKPDDNS